MNEKQYLINDEPASARDIIHLADELDDNFKNDWLKQTSVAANILRKNGYIVKENKLTGEE